jgi:hypothetical protein
LDKVERFLVLHDFESGDQPNSDIPRAREAVFLNDTVLAMKIARAAIIYLILFVEYEKRKNTPEGLTAPIFPVPLDDGFRHKPKY